SFAKEGSHAITVHATPGAPQDTKPTNNKKTDTIAVTGADLVVTATGLQKPLLTDASHTLTLNVKNLGPAATTGVSFGQVWTGDLTIESVTPQAGVTCDPQVGKTLACTATSLAVNGSVSVALKFKSAVPVDSAHTLGARELSGAIDEKPLTNSKLVAVNIVAPDLASTAHAPVAAAVGVNQRAKFKHTVKNSDVINSVKTWGLTQEFTFLPLNFAEPGTFEVKVISSPGLSCPGVTATITCTHTAPLAAIVPDDADGSNGKAVATFDVVGVDLELSDLTLSGAKPPSPLAAGLVFSANAQCAVGPGGANSGVTCNVGTIAKNTLTTETFLTALAKKGTWSVKASATATDLGTLSALTKTLVVRGPDLKVTANPAPTKTLIDQTCEPTPIDGCCETADDCPSAPCTADVCSQGTCQSSRRLLPGRRRLPGPRCLHGRSMRSERLPVHRRSGLLPGGRRLHRRHVRQRVRGYPRPGRRHLRWGCQHDRTDGVRCWKRRTQRGRGQRGRIILG
ncbi:MAG: hypothetical protein ACI9OJ_002939, partial [Myxococcota bacterium]